MAGADGYKERWDDRRCEGFFTAPVSAPGLEIVSVTLGPIGLGPEVDRLNIIAPDVAGLDAETVQLRAVGVPARMYYRMDAATGTGGVFTWPAADVLAREHLAPETIGVYGWLRGRSGHVFVPVAVTTADAAEPAPIMLTLRTFTPIDRLLWREMPLDGQRTEWAPVNDTRLAAGSSVAFELPDGKPGLLRLEFRALRTGTDEWMPLDATIWRPVP